MQKKYSSTIRTVVQALARNPEEISGHAAINTIYQITETALQSTFLSYIYKLSGDEKKSHFFLSGFKPFYSN